MNSLFSGAIAMASFVAALFFYRFWRNTRDRFFLLFAIAFLVDTVNRASLGMLPGVTKEQEPFFYLIRLGTFVLILAAVIDKNLRSGRRR